VFRSTEELESIKVVHEVLRSGINYIDVAPWYGHGKAETVLGKVTGNSSPNTFSKPHV
jgi:aryl-alcohol dehydrogenase-like predicted oxidoreductase